MSDDLGLGDGSQDIIVLHDGRTMQTHGPKSCLGPHCCIHNPSEHPLRDAPLHWMGELKMMFRVCKHEHLHPDPDALTFHQMLALAGLTEGFYDGYHPCCDHHCCNEDRVNE